MTEPITTKEDTTPGSSKEKNGIFFPEERNRTTA
jgi:hypothetical protein